MAAHKDGNKIDPKIKFNFFDWINSFKKLERCGVKL